MRLKKLNADPVRRVVLTHLAHPSRPIDLDEINTFVRWLGCQALLVGVLVLSCWVASRIDAQALSTIF